MVRVSIALVLVMLFIVASAGARTIYTWKDKSGVTHISDTPIQGAEVAIDPSENSAPDIQNPKTQLDQAMEEATAPIDRMAARHKAASERIMGDLAHRVDTINETARRETQAVQASSLSQQEIGRETARITLEAEEQKLTAVETAGRDMEAAWNQTYGRAIEIARAAGLDTTKLSQEATAAKVKNYETLEREYQRIVDFLIAEEERLTRRIQELDDERANVSRDFKDRKRALMQTLLQNQGTER